MAEDKKLDLNLDDWDSIPLDPDADDWDDLPASAPPSPPPPPVPTLAEEPEPDTIVDFDLPENSDFFSKPDKADETPDAASGAPDERHLDAFETPEAAPAPAVDKAAGNDSGPIAAPAPPRPPVQAVGVDDADQTEDDFDAHLGANDIENAFAAMERRTAPPPEIPEAEPDFEDLTTKKVELDIDGIFFDGTGDDAPTEPEPEPEPEPPAAEQPALEEPPPEPVGKKIPIVKLLIIVIPALLFLSGAAFGLYKLFFSSSGASPAAREAVIDPRVPPRDPVPGEMPLEPFYIAFPGSQGDTLVEMAIVLHYNDFPDKAAVGEGLVTVRDLIFRAVQGKGSRIISDGEMQKALREELAADINLALGREAVSYVGITQIKILH